MSFAGIRHELETARRLPQAALRDAMAHADELAPVVVELIGKVKAGVYLLPGQAQLLLYGVHVLAAAGAAALWPAWCDLLRLPSEYTADLFGDEVVTIVTAVTACLAADDVPAVVALLEDPGVSEDVRWALFPVLARLAWEGRADLADTRALLERFAREAWAAPEDSAWNGWLDAVRLLGLVDLMPLIEAVMAKLALGGFNAADRRDTLERLAAAAADFAEEGRFLEDQVAPFDDPVEGLWWQRSYQAREDEWLAERAADEPDEPADPAAGIALTEQEEDWLRGFLESRQVPLGTLDLETLDGFFCALVVGPGPVPSSEYLPNVWGGGLPVAGPVYDGEDQRRFVEDLLSRYWNAIARRIADGAGHDPFLFAGDEAERGCDWAMGFGLGIALREAEWESVVRRRKPGILVASILALDYIEAGPIAPDQRSAIVDDLPGIVLTLAEVFRRAGQEPARSRKIGRNEPCPCGSGKKHKKCCGANPPAAPR